MTDLTSQEQEAAARIKESERSDLAAIALLIGSSFLLYRYYMRRRLREEFLQGPLTRRRLVELNKLLFVKFGPTFVTTLVPSLTAGYLQGLREAKIAPGNTQWMRAAAEQYAIKLGDVIHETSSRALIDGFTAQINRRVPARMAIDRAIDAFGVTPRTMKALVSVWLGPAPKESPTAIPLKNRVAERADRMVAKAITDRANMVGEAEAYAAKNQAKSVLWMYRKDRMPESARVVWYTAKDERVCSVCGPLHGKSRKVDEPFKIKGVGKVWGPPLHPRCRCDVALAERVDNNVLSMTLQQAQLLEEFREPIAKREFNERDHPRARSGQFTRKYAQRPVQTQERTQTAAERLFAEAERQRAAEAHQVVEDLLQHPGEITAEREGFVAPGSFAAPVIFRPPTVFSAPTSFAPPAQVTFAPPAIQFRPPEFKPPSFGPPGFKAPQRAEAETAFAPPSGIKPKEEKRKFTGKWHQVPKEVGPLYVALPPSLSTVVISSGDYPIRSFYYGLPGQHPAERALEEYWGREVFEDISTRFEEHEHYEEFPGVGPAILLDDEMLGYGSETQRIWIVTPQMYEDAWRVTIGGYGISDSPVWNNAQYLDSEFRVSTGPSVNLVELADALGISAEAEELTPELGYLNYLPDEDYDEEDGVITFVRDHRFFFSGPKDRFTVPVDVNRQDLREYRGGYTELVEIFPQEDGEDSHDPNDY